MSQNASDETEKMIVTQKDRLKLLKTPRGIAYMVPVALLLLATGVGGVAMIGGGIAELIAGEPNARMLGATSVSTTRQMGHIEKMLTLCADEEDQEVDFFGRRLESEDETRSLAEENIAIWMTEGG